MTAIISPILILTNSLECVKNTVLMEFSALFFPLLIGKYHMDNVRGSFVEMNMCMDSIRRLHELRSAHSVHRSFAYVMRKNRRFLVGRVAMAVAFFPPFCGFFFSVLFAFGLHAN